MCVFATWRSHHLSILRMPRPNLTDCFTWPKIDSYQICTKPPLEKTHSQGSCIWQALPIRTDSRGETPRTTYFLCFLCHASANSTREEILPCLRIPQVYSHHPVEDLCSSISSAVWEFGLVEHMQGKKRTFTTLFQEWHSLGCPFYPPVENQSICDPGSRPQFEASGAEMPALCMLWNGLGMSRETPAEAEKRWPALCSKHPLAFMSGKHQCLTLMPGFATCSPGTHNHGPLVLGYSEGQDQGRCGQEAQFHKQPGQSSTQILM